MQDVQNMRADIPVPIDSVGVRNLRLPISVSLREGGRVHSSALVSLGVELPAAFKGTHMSRFVEALENWNEDLSYQSMKSLLNDVRRRLDAEKAQIVFEFPFFLRREAPVTSAPGLQSYDCRLTGELTREKLKFLLEVTIPVMTVCPCSKAISKEGAHSQRADVRISVRLKGFAWMEEFIEMAEGSASSPTYPVLKREDEKFVTEQSFAAPHFVEDVVRSAAEKIEQHPQVTWFRVEVESHESIHAHNAYARIERTLA